MKQQLWCLSDDHGIYIYNIALAGAHFSGRFLEKSAAGLPSPPGVRIRKKLSNNALAQGPQQRIADGMPQGIGVGMAVQTLGMGNIDAAQNELAACNQRMHVVTNPNTDHSAV